VVKNVLGPGPLTFIVRGPGPNTKNGICKYVCKYHPLVKIYIKVKLLGFLNFIIILFTV